MPLRLSHRHIGTDLARFISTDAPAQNPICAIMVKPEWLGNEDDDQALVRFAKKASLFGYNALLMWDWDLSRPTIPDYTRRLYDTTSNWFHDNNWSLIVECCPQGAFLQASGWFNDPEFSSHDISQFYEPQTYGDEYYICLKEPLVHPIYMRIVSNISNVFPQGSPLIALMAAYDEWRVAGKHTRCANESSGMLLAQHAQRTMDIFHERMSWALPAAWSDMFNPFENARSGYYNAGDMTRAQDFARGGELIIDWSAKKEAFQFFNQRGCQQINAGFYDWDPQHPGNDGDNFNPTDERKFCNSVASYACGYCYTTWKPDLNSNKLQLYNNSGKVIPWQIPKLAGTIPPPPPTPTPPPPPSDDLAAMKAQVAQMKIQLASYNNVVVSARSQAQGLVATLDAVPKSIF